MELPLLSGRDFLPEDRAAGAEPVVVLNRAAVDRFFPAEDPIGRAIGFESEGPWLRVVGVTENVVVGSLGEPPMLRAYVPRMDLALPWRVGTRWFVVRSEGPPASALRASIVAAVRAVDPGQPISSFGALTDMRDGLLDEQRFRSVAFGVFALLGLTLGVVGVYGVVSYSVARGAREAALRAALGAAPRTLLWFVLHREGVPVIAGALAGIVCAAGVGRLLAGLLFDITPLDPLTLAAASLLVVALGGVAIWVPAQRLMGTHPGKVLAGD